jgi:hypothetical protein
MAGRESHQVSAGGGGPKRSSTNFCITDFMVLSLWESKQSSRKSGEEQLREGRREKEEGKFSK